MDTDTLCLGRGKKGASLTSKITGLQKRGVRGVNEHLGNLPGEGKYAGLSQDTGLWTGRFGELGPISGRPFDKASLSPRGFG